MNSTRYSISVLVVLWGLLLVGPTAAFATGSVEAEAVQLLEIDKIQSEMNWTGAGVRIAIMTQGISGYDDSRDSGDMPTVEVINGFIDPQDFQGGIMVEIIHDIAPDATVGLSRTLNNFEIAQNMNAVLGWNPDIILLSHMWVTSLMFERSEAFEALKRAHDQGVLVIAGAGEWRTAHYRAQFTDNGSGLHDFGGGQTRLPVHSPMWFSQIVSLHWDDPKDDYTDKFELWIFDDNGDLKDIGRDTITNPVVTASLSGGDDATYEIEIHRVEELSDPVTIGLAGTRGHHQNQETVSFSSHNEPTHSLIGVGASPHVLTVGSQDQDSVIDAGPPTLYAIQSYSGEGPAEFLIPSRETLNKPDLATFDCQSVTSNVVTVEPRACGSVASTSVTAGVAALAQQAYGFENRTKIKELFTTTASDLPPDGWDGRSGYGQLNAWAALSPKIVPALSTYSVLIAIAAAGLFILWNRPRTVLPRSRD